MRLSDGRKMEIAPSVRMPGTFYLRFTPERRHISALFDDDDKVEPEIDYEGHRYQLHQIDDGEGVYVFRWLRPAHRSRRRGAA